MTLPWVRIDTNLARHPKILDLLDDPSPQRWRAAFSYVSAIGWSADVGSDGHVPPNALPLVHGNPTTARLLVKYRLWEEGVNGWTIHNYGVRQQLASVAELKRLERATAAARAACTRWHGVNCWGPKGCSREATNHEPD